MTPKAARARLQNIKISKYLETRRLTEDVFGECGRKPWRGDTPHAREPLSLSKIKNYRDFWVPYKKYCGDQLPCITVVAGYRTKYSAVANYRPPTTVQYRGGCLPRQTLPRKALNISLSPFAPGNLVSRDGFGRPVPRQPAHSPHPG